VPKPAEAGIVWQVVLPDRAASIRAEGDQVVVSSLDGSQTTVDSSGKIVAQKAGPVPVVAAPPAVDAKTLPKEKLGDRIAKWVATAGDATALGYWGGAVQVFAKTGEIKAQRQLPQDIACMGWHKDRLIVGLADGRVVALAIR
jgi:hypothetical protein